LREPQAETPAQVREASASKPRAPAAGIPFERASHERFSPSPVFASGFHALRLEASKLLVAPPFRDNAGTTSYASCGSRRRRS
jgi:hypothetical protein